MSLQIRNALAGARKCTSSETVRLVVYLQSPHHRKLGLRLVAKGGDGGPCTEAHTHYQHFVFVGLP